MVRTTTPVIPLVDLQAQFRTIRQPILRATARVLQSGAYILGPEVQAFEREMARCCTTRYGVGVASGTDALELALRAVGIGPGDEVITSAFTFIATVEAIIEVGAKPVLVDIDPVTYTLHPAHVAWAITKRTKAIIPVHLYGQPADMDALTRLARRHRLKLIEDCAQAIGATYRGRRVGSLGDAGCLSFYPAKNLGAYGDGGAVVTNNRRVADRVRLLRAHGGRDKYRNETHGMNSRLDELQAAYLRIKLQRLSRWNAARRRVAGWYTTALRRAGFVDTQLPIAAPHRTHVYHLYVLRTTRRRRILETCRRQGIQVGLHYPIAIHRQRALQWLRYRVGAFPHSERAAREVLSLPLFPEMTKTQVSRVVRTIIL